MIDKEQELRNALATANMCHTNRAMSAARDREQVVAEADRGFNRAIAQSEKERDQQIQAAWDRFHNA